MSLGPGSIDASILPYPMASQPPDLNRPSDARDTLEVSADELERPSKPADVGGTVASIGAQGPRGFGRNVGALLLVIVSIVLASTLLLRSARRHRVSPPAIAHAATLQRAAANVGPPAAGETPGLACSDANALVPEQYIELDAVKMKGLATNKSRRAVTTR